jgi:hypothetical protein
VPRISGQVTAWIDGAGSGDTPETDGWGRYKILFPLDVSGRGDGKASSWIRMAQPYVGMGYGQHFPLTPGTEVLISFVDGNPDRPVITGAVPNAETGNLVNASNPNQAALGSKGGGSLVFGNDPEKQNVTLSAGSDRGFFTIASGSPTTAAMYADVTSTTSTVNSTTNMFMSNNTAGYRYEIGAGDAKMRKLTLILGALRETFETMAAASQEAAYYQGFRDDSRDYSPAVMCNNVTNTVDFLIDAADPIIGVLANQNAEPPDLRLPDSNLLAIVGDAEGSRTTWKSKNPFGTLDKLLTTFLLLMKPARHLQPAADDILPLFSIGDEPDGFSKQDERLKHAAKGVAVTTGLSEVVCDVLSTYTLIKALWGAEGKLTAKGILIHNKDSYVDVLAETWAGVSAKTGPLVLESSPQRAADDLRCSLPSVLATLPECLGSESTGASSVSPLLESAVLLHGKLVRTFCDELSLSAKDIVAAKSPGKVLIMQAPAPEEAPAPEVPAGFDVIDATPSGLETLASRNVKFNYIPTYEKGIDITTTDPNAALIIQTTQPSAPVAILCGSSDADGCRSLTFDNGDGTVLRESRDASLVMNQQGVTLKADDQKKLAMTATGEVKLSQSGTNSLAFNDQNVTMEHGMELNLKGGATSVNLNAQGFKLSTEAFADFKAQILNLG